ncbi:hypothetical protein M0R45_016505 [Rubus argutus]|uniref:Uncharacterized protein n=1 Tax=Rubus argutus TaxID=59490 RepID=A0AAW1XU53_RUBAR
MVMEMPTWWRERLATAWAISGLVLEAAVEDSFAVKCGPRLWEITGSTPAVGDESAVTVIVFIEVEDEVVSP